MFFTIPRHERVNSSLLPEENFTFYNETESESGRHHLELVRSELSSQFFLSFFDSSLPIALTNFQVFDSTPKSQKKRKVNT